MLAPGAVDPTIEPLRARDQSRAADVLARAFCDNPLNRAVLEGRSAPARRRANAAGMRALLPTARAYGVVLCARLGAHPAGVLIAAPPHAYPFPQPGWGARLRALAGQGLTASRRWSRVFESLDRVHPHKAHWYLATLGVDPAVQRRAIGTALLQRWLAGSECDAVPAYLETDRSENLPLYRRAGFETVGDTDVLGVRVFLMSRPARGSGSALRPAGAPVPVHCVGPGAAPAPRLRDAVPDDPRLGGEPDRHDLPTAGKA